MSASGEWNCDVNEKLVKQAQQESAESPNKSESPSTDTASKADAAPVPQNTAATKQDETTTDAPPIATTAAASAPLPVTSGDNNTNQPVTSTNTFTDANSNDQWRCAAQGEQWSCQQNTVALASTTPSNGSTVAQPYANLDWYYYSPEKQAQGLCPGHYVEPDLGLTSSNKPVAQQAIFLDALRSSTRLGGVTQLEGGINIRQGGRSLTSDKAKFDQTSRQASLTHNVRYREKNMLLIGDSAEADLNSGKTSFNNAQYVLHQEHMRGSAHQIVRQGNNDLLIKQGRVTFCEPGNDSWAIGASELNVHTTEGYGEAWNAKLEVAGVPVLYLPYFYFPINDTRRSGFLYPNIGYSSGDGADIATPYYFNLAPNYDDTLTPRIITKRGLVLENEFRYMNDWSMNQLSTGYIFNDQIYGKSRWLLGYKQDGNPSQHWYTHVDYTHISDNTYLDDLDTANLDITKQDNLDQLAEARYEGNSWRFTTRVHKYQTINGAIEPYEKVPQLLLTGSRAEFSGQMNIDYTADLTRFSRNNSLLTGSDKIVGTRLHLRPSLSTQWDRPWGYLHPRLTYWYSQYALEDQPANWEKTPSLGVPVVSLDTGMRFERALPNGYTQTLEPRMMLLSVSQQDQSSLPQFDSSRLDFNYYNLFSETGYSGNDNIAGTEQATLGLSSVFYAEDGSEKARLGLGQAYYFEDRSTKTGLRPGDVTGKESSSNFAAMASWHVTPALTLSHDSEIDKDSFSLRQQNYRLQYLPDDLHLLYLSYRDNTEASLPPADQVRQTDLAFRWPLNPAWNLVGRWQKDLLQHKNLDTLLGVEYATCCWKVRLTGRKWVQDTAGSTTGQNKTGIFLQFVLRGLGAFGQQGGRQFLNDITGANEDKHEKF